jgi:hypothetical protein
LCAAVLWHACFSMQLRRCERMTSTGFRAGFGVMVGYGGISLILG